MSEELKAAQIRVETSDDFFEKNGLNKVLDDFLNLPEVQEVLQKEYENLESGMDERVKTWPVEKQEELRRRKTKDFYFPKSLYIYMVKSTCKTMLTEVVMKYQKEKVSENDIVANAKTLLDTRFNLENLWIIETYAASTVRAMLGVYDGIASGEIKYPLTANLNS